MQLIERTFICPDLDTQSGAMLIKEALGNTPGVFDADVSLAHRTVRVVLRDPEGEQTVRRHLSAVGYPAE
jgi:copper chaperone CopZ